MRLARAFVALPTGSKVASATVMLAGALTWAFWSGGRPVLQPGRTSDDHHLISAACSACHTPFVGVTNDACQACHQRELEHDTHPVSVFDDPRWASSQEAERALLCTGCHREHQGGSQVVQLDAGFCFACHDDVVEKRPSHAALAPRSCGESGCHNYHDNSVLNEAFLRRQLAAPLLASGPGLRAVPRLLLRRAPRPALAAALRVPAGLEAEAEIVARWRAGAHAGANVGCGDCHQPAGQALIRRPGRSVCAKCHGFAAETFLTGKHGVRGRVGLSPLEPRLARLPMRPPHPRQPAAFGCGSCHEPHRIDTAFAATAACLGCHADKHSLAFADSPHSRYRGSSFGGAITCATCHMPRTTSPDRQKVVVEHGNTFTLRPRDRMLGSVCLDCHGLAFAMSSLYDDALVENNFRGRPQIAHQTLELLRTTTPGEAQR
ncbi:MAG TPA: cytochrome c3 family protein [Thermoanaerobaculia bacterium]|nr:cytochrome c3 family protein [Thermoanaerobaculia bacterium]